MPPSVPFLLEVWREVCRHVAIEESVAGAAGLLSRELACDYLLIRSIDPRTGTVETVAAAGTAMTVSIREESFKGELERLHSWCLGGRVLRQPSQELRKALPGLLQEGVSGDVLAAPLTLDTAHPAALLLATRPPRRFQPDHEALMQALAEPFAVAWSHDRRMREFDALRKTAEAEKRSLLTKLGRSDLNETIIGVESGLRRVMQQVEQVAGSNVPVLILGETGSGKEVVARAIHQRSRRAAGPFIRVNCGAIPSELIDSELFGHEKGSFTGAVALRTGWFERADGGTLFLDECGELPLAAQVRLLRILQDGTFQRVGGEKQLHVEVRIVAATHRDLKGMASQGRFREDLWYRMAVFPIQLPPLRDRPQDVAGLANHFALRAAHRLGSAPLAPTAEDIQLLMAYPWPGNVRELAAVIERAAILGDGKRLEVAQALGFTSPVAPPPMLTLQQTPRENAVFLSLDAAMARHIEAALTRTRGRIEGPDGAAAILGINPHTLRARMRKLEVDWTRFRDRRAA